MSGEKTEQPTAKRMQDTRKKGDVAHSKDFTQTMLIIALFGYLLGAGKTIFQSIAEMVLLAARQSEFEFSDVVHLLIGDLIQAAVIIILPFLIIVIGVGIFAEILQVGILFAFEKLKPSAKKLNVLANLKNTFSKKNFIEFLKSIVKITFLTILVYLVLKDALPQLVTIPHAGLAGAFMSIESLIKTLLINIALAYTVIALADFVWQRAQFRKQQMMSKDEVKQEYKEMEGDPHIKHMRRHLHKEMVMHGARQSARKATVLVTNPTHYAVALYYEKDETPLPVVLAKGEGALAEQMIQEAKDAGVPIMQNIELAHALIANGQLDQYIPSELVEAVAEVLRAVRDLVAVSEFEK